VTGRLPVLIPFLVCLGALCACMPERVARASHEPVVEELVVLLEARPDLRDALARAIESADLEGIGDLNAFCRHLDELVTWIPVQREIVPKALGVYYIINQAPDDALNEDDAFSAWLHRLVSAWGEYLDTPASAAGIESFASLPDFKVDDYVAGPSGWLSFNQFFARQIRPGKRPVADAGDDAVIVSPADAVFMGAWPIDDNSRVTVKGVDWSIAELLDGSPYAAEFRNGLYMHSFLRITDYHRYHVPVGGVIREVRNVHGRVYMDVVKGPDGKLNAVNGHTYQFNQERGIVIIDSPVVGLVAVLPVGMTFISSVNLTPEVGAELRKGEEFGYFMFGGSDIVMVFQDKDAVLEAEVGRKYLQGQRIGRVEARD